MEIGKNTMRKYIKNYSSAQEWWSDLHDFGFYSKNSLCQIYFPNRLFTTLGEKEVSQVWEKENLLFKNSLGKPAKRTVEKNVFEISKASSISWGEIETEMKRKGVRLENQDRLFSGEDTDEEGVTWHYVQIFRKELETDEEFERRLEMDHFHLVNLRENAYKNYLSSLHRFHPELIEKAKELSRKVAEEGLSWKEAFQELKNSLTF